MHRSRAKFREAARKLEIEQKKGMASQYTKEELAESKRKTTFHKGWPRRAR